MLMPVCRSGCVWFSFVCCGKLRSIADEHCRALRGDFLKRFYKVSCRILLSHVHVLSSKRPNIDFCKVRVLQTAIFVRHHNLLAAFTHQFFSSLNFHKMTPESVYIKTKAKPPQKRTWRGFIKKVIPLAIRTLRELSIAICFTEQK